MNMPLSMQNLPLSARVIRLKERMLSQPRYASIEQAKIITDVYKANADKPRIICRALSLAAALDGIEISLEPEELIVGNRTAGVRSGVVFPESGCSWVDREFETLPTRKQDRFQIHPQDARILREEILPYWRGKSLEDTIKARYGEEISAIAKVVKINQKDHAQGHICPDCALWLATGPEALAVQAEEKLQTCEAGKRDFYQSAAIVMRAASRFMLRYAHLSEAGAQDSQYAMHADELRTTAAVCTKLAHAAPQSFREALQSLWFLFVILHMESNASSFSPGRADEYLYPFYARDIKSGALTQAQALELIECLYLKFNQIVYMRNAGSAKYFAGFPIGFNIAIGGQDAKGNDFCNDLSFLFLKAQAHIGLPQPNLSLRLNAHTSDALLHEAVCVVAKGSGMPQFFNDKAVIPALENLGITEADARDYAIVGCVELTPQGNNLGWSDAAMFNLNKALELALSGGVDLLTGAQIAPDYGDLAHYESFAALETAFAHHIDDYIERMRKACELVERAHMELLPTPFLSAVIDDCMERGLDVTAGGAHYNLSGIQMIQVANLADSLAAIKQLVFDERRVRGAELLEALRNNFEGCEALRTRLANRVPKYGNDVEWVDALGAKWAEYFRDRLAAYKNFRGGRYHTGMYTVSAHVPMGENVGATPDGRRAGQPLADGGMSPVYGRDTEGPTAVLKSVARMDKTLTSNGGLLNMKFLPSFFQSEAGIQKFMLFLRTFVDLEIPHIQFNVVRREDLLAAKAQPENYRGLTVRVAGYTAYFTELAGELQDEIIARTSYEGI